MILEILSYRLSLREGGSFAADDEAISLLSEVGDCFGKERLAMTPGLGDFQNSFDDLLSSQAMAEIRGKVFQGQGTSFK